MKVKEVMEMLSQLDPESEVILQKDAEGNSYSPLYAVDGDAFYVPTTTWYGTAYRTTYTAADNCMTEEEWAAVKTQRRCVVLAPVN